jgi:hypothetical protein
MEYIKSKNRDRYASEYADVLPSLSKLIKNPKGMVLSNSVGMLTVLTIVLCMCSVAMTLDAFDKPSVRAFGFVGLVYVTIIFLIIQIIKKNNLKKYVLEKKGETQMECDSEGITFSVPGYRVKTYWSALQCIREFNYTMFFIAKDNMTQSFCIPVENLGHIKSFLKENDIDLPVIKV